MAKISVIIPCYNVEKYLERCLKSMLDQTFQEWEAICVNDGSPDNSINILERFSKIDNRIKVISQYNQGLSMARNNAMKLATGDYVCCLDSDDALHPQALEIIYTLAQKNSADLVSYKLESHSFNEDEWVSFKGRNREKYALSLNSCTKLYKRSLLEGIEWIPGISFEDVPHTYAVLAKKPKTVVINEILYFYTVDGESIFHSKSNPKQIEDYHKGINSIFDIFDNQNLRAERAFLIKNFVPNILQQQLARCRHADKNMKSKMYEAFGVELRDLNDKKLINWRYHRLIKYMVYLGIMKIY